MITLPTLHRARPQTPPPPLTRQSDDWITRDPAKVASLARWAREVQPHVERLREVIK